MKNTTWTKRMLSLLLCVAMLLSNAPLSASAATNQIAQAAVVDAVTDPGTADSWETMMGTDADGNRYAGRMWVDKSVYQNGDTVNLGNGKTFTVGLEADEAFQIVFSALGSTMTTKKTTTSTGPVDVVLVLDTSTSMDDTDSSGVTRLERTITAANALLEDLLTIKNVRIAIVTYNADSETVLPLAVRNNGIKLVVENYFNNFSANAGVVTAYDKDNNVLGADDGYTQGTNLQAGIDRGFNILANATDVAGRVPVAIVLTDGQANRAHQNGFHTITDADGSSASNRNLYLSTLLNAAYNKTKIEENYGKEATVYTVGVDVSGNTVAQLLMNPADSNNGFYDYGNNRGKSEITQAYRSFQTWASGRSVTYSGWTFDHNYPNWNGAITDAKIAANIYYADTYYDVSSAELEATFNQIYEELSSGAFNPISNSASAVGGTGEDGYPLIYVDFIGQHMEVKEIEAISLFGASYGVTRNENGAYVVTAGTGHNPTTDEQWNTAEDILITVNAQPDGTQKLEVRINREILPIIMEQAASETVGSTTVSTITELKQEPLRLFYTVGVASDILLPNGKVDVSKIQGYEYIDDQTGTVSFYSNRFGVMNPAAGKQNAVNGDAHVGFLPSAENRYYYHQENQGIFTKITNKADGSEVTIPANNEYGIEWDESKYELTWMTYEVYQQMREEDRVYTYVSYYRPTPSTTDAANAAQEVTYLVYTRWQYLKESIAFYDATNKSYLNDGKAIAADAVTATVAAYTQSNPGAQLYAVLGVGSHRTSRLHNMTVAKLNNVTATASNSYAPEYTYSTAATHNGNDVVVWLGNNGKLTVQIDTGIALTKRVTEPIGNAEDVYALTLTLPQGVTANPAVVDENGNAVRFDYSGNTITVYVKADQTAYISGIPGGTQCMVNEQINGDYYVQSKTDTVTVPLVSQVLGGADQYAPATVTNAPYKFGNLFITKEITSEHIVPDSVLDTTFQITVNVGAALAGKAFTVEDSNAANAYDVTVDSQGNMTFNIKARQTVQILRLPAGTTATITEAAPGSHFTASYRTRNHSGETADNDNVLVIPADGNATAVVLNAYKPASVSVALDIAGTKNFVAEGAHDGGTFTYKVQSWNGTQWTDLPGKTAQTPYAANESGTKNFAISNVLEGIVYETVGSYAYQVVEVKGNVANVTYDRTLYAFDVNVTDNGGQLVATITDRQNTEITDGSYEVVFNNTYHTATVSVDIAKLVVNNSGDNTITPAGFAFNAVRTDENWNVLTGTDAATLQVVSDAAGKARLTATYSAAGNYYYVLTERNNGAPGWNYSGAQYRITVTVTENSGDLTAALQVEKFNSQNEKEYASVDINDATKGYVTFENTYAPTAAQVDLSGTVKKQLIGKTLEAGMFSFYVFENDAGAARNYQNALLTGTNDPSGNVDFAAVLTFSKAGKYAFDIVEFIPDGAVYNAATGRYEYQGMRYDPTIYDLVVEVVNNKTTGALEANYYFEDAVADTVVYNNSYRAEPTAYTLGGNKILNGRATRSGEFNFALYQGNTLLQTVTNRADGSFTFDPITYQAAGTYVYEIREVEPADNEKAPGVAYTGADHPVTVRIVVTDVNGQLQAAPSVSNRQIRFENTYTAAPAQVAFNGVKELVGGTLEDDAFSFRFYRTDNTFDISKNTAILLDTAGNGDGKFNFTQTLYNAGAYYFVIAEDTTACAENIVYDRTQHAFTVMVSDAGDGKLRATLTNVKTGDTEGADVSVTASVSFTNATFEQATEKEVYLDSNVTEKVDGKKVNAGDILTYFITYTNYTGQDAQVDILDAVPANTTYVEGTATHGGAYASDHIRWALNVPVDGEVTVSFQVKVNTADAVVANTAVIRDGVNTYTTNEVTNHTYDAPGKKDVELVSAPDVSVDGQKVNVDDELLYKITYTNYTGKEAAVTITDQIPANTAYVSGSASHGATFAEGTLAWNLTVAANAEVTVSFKVKVVSAQAQIANTATIAENSDYRFTTNTVTNNTITEETLPSQPEPTPPAVPTVVPGLPKTGDDTNLVLLAGVLILSGAAMTALLVTAQKKEQNQ